MRASARPPARAHGRADRRSPWCGRAGWRPGRSWRSDQTRLPSHAQADGGVLVVVASGETPILHKLSVSTDSVGTPIRVNPENRPRDIAPWLVVARTAQTASFSKRRPSGPDSHATSVIRFEL